MARPPSFQKYKQDPADVLDYRNNWRTTVDPFLAPTEVISTSTWTAYDIAWAPTDDITIDSTPSSHTDTTTTVWVSDGELGVTYYLTNHIVTDEGREKDETISITIEEQ